MWFFLAWGFLVHATELPTFRLNLNTEPVSLKPWEQRNSSAGYFLSQIYGTLLVYQDKVLKPRLAEKCEFKSEKKIECLISENAKWSDGTAITAEDFERAWLGFLDPKNHAFRADLLFNIKNAEKFYLGHRSRKSLGLKIDKNKITILLERNDPDFLYTLTSPLLAPQKTLDFPEAKEADKLLTSGPYVIEKWEPQKKITLKGPHAKIEFLFVQEDSTALNLYEKKTLHFLRRLPSLYIPKFKIRRDYHEVDQLRFDYIGFGPQLKNKLELRKALALSLPYEDLTKILSGEGQYGCPGISPDLMQKIPCHIFDLPLAKKNLAQAKKKGPLPKLTFAFSKQGGEDHRRVAEWIQAQWKKNLGLEIELQQVENKIFTEQLKIKPPAIFRKGVSSERPTCLSVMESFAENSSENYLHIKGHKFKQLLKQLRAAKNNKADCSQAVKYFIDSYLLIPTGPIYFSLLVRPEWIGWNLNELNQLDLWDLRRSH